MTAWLLVCLVAIVAGAGTLVAYSVDEWLRVKRLLRALEALDHLAEGSKR